MGDTSYTEEEILKLRDYFQHGVPVSQGEGMALCDQLLAELAWRAAAKMHASPSEAEHSWAVFCAICGDKWSVEGHHPGRSVCESCVAEFRRMKAALSGATILLQVAEMEEHNEGIFSGKWKKGSKAWSGEFIKRLRAEGLAKMQAAKAPL
jgi:hypothetical protein